MVDWDSWRAHIDSVVADEGRWVGLGDADGVPLMRLPLESLASRERVQDTGDGELQMPTIGSYGQTHMAVQAELVVPEGDGTGRLVPKLEPGTVIIATRGGRVALPTSHPDAEAHPEAPQSMRIPFESMLGLLASWPCPSIPMTWKADTMQERTQDAAVTYKKPRRYAPVEMATKADGFTVQGEAITVIREIIQDSLDAANTVMGWTGDEHLVVDYAPTELTPRTVSIRTADDLLLDTVQPWAQDAGVALSVSLWWPGDDAVTVRTADRASTVQRTWGRPIGVVHVTKMGD